MSVKTLIVYSTKSGINEEVAVEMANVLKTTNKNEEVTVADLRDGQPDIAPYQNIIVGAGVRGKAVYREAVDFLGKNFVDKNVALYFSCEDSENPKMEKTEENMKKALTKNIALKPVDVTAFGGCTLLDGRPVLDEKNLSKVRDWASELEKKFDAKMPPMMAAAAGVGMMDEKMKGSDLLGQVPSECVFRFFVAVGENTGVTAASTVEFEEKLQNIPIESVNFHFQRQDFQRWLKDSVGDKILAKKIDNINLWAHDEDLRKELSNVVQNRIDELMQSPVSSSPKS